MAAAPNHLETKKTRNIDKNCLKRTLKTITISHFKTEIKAKIEVYSIFTELHGHHKSYTFSCRFYVPHPIPPQVCRALLELAAPPPFYTRKFIVKHIKMGVAARVRSPDLHAGETLVQNRAKTISKIFEFLYFVPNLRCVDACDCHTCSNATKQFLNEFPHMFGAAALLIGEPVIRDFSTRPAP